MKKNNTSRAASKDARSPLKVLAIIAVIAVAILFIAGGIWRALARSEHFRVRHIVVKQGSALELDHLRGRNIFSIDLSRQSELISRFYPDLKSVKLSRVLPDRIYVDARPREAVAAIKLYKTFAVDADGLLFEFHDGSKEEGLPVITGLETKIFGPKAGNRYDTRELLLSLELIKESSAARELKDCRIVKINAASPANLSVIYDMSALLKSSVDDARASRKPHMEVKFGGAVIRNKVRLLENILVQERKEISGIKYIDLRFANPVIKFDDPKK